MVYKIKVCWYDDISEEEKKDGLFLVAESHVNAIEKLVNYYGEKNLLGLKIEPWARDDFILFNRENPAEESLFNTIDKDIGKNMIW